VVEERITETGGILIPLAVSKANFWVRWPPYPGTP
jgi:hypothetical protein